MQVHLLSVAKLKLYWLFLKKQTLTKNVNRQYILNVKKFIAIHTITLFPINCGNIFVFKISSSGQVDITTFNVLFCVAFCDDAFCTEQNLFNLKSTIAPWLVG